MHFYLTRSWHLINCIIEFKFIKFITLLNMGGSNPEEITFIYNGVEYDATDYAHKHPGGFDFIDNMRKQRKDFSQYFKCLHSEQAEKILKSFPIVATHEPSKSSQEYNQILKKIEHLYQPIWSCEVALTITLLATLLIACTTQYAVVSIVLFAFTQIVAGWVGHSMAHNRHPLFLKYGRAVPALLGGFSLEWWSPKHNMHHIFTNSQLYDDDIKHDYKVYLYEFLYLKWRFDSLVSAITKLNYLELVFMTGNYIILFYNYQNLPYFLIGNLLGGFYSAFVLIGNHERQKRYENQIKASFIDHQIITCRNYEETNFFWLIMMGGMQFQTQHHLFPRIPFYRLPDAVPIIKEELAKLNKSIIYGPVL